MIATIIVLIIENKVRKAIEYLIGSNKVSIDDDLVLIDDDDFVDFDDDGDDEDFL